MDPSWVGVSKLPPLHPVTPRRTILHIPSRIIRRGEAVDVVYRASAPCRMREFKTNWIGERARVLGAFVMSTSIFREDFAAGRYRIADMNKMFADAPGPTALVGADVVLRLEFDWPEKSWMPKENEFRCWWVADVLR